MPSEQSPDSKFEIGHVLFIDIVGYSRLLIEEQKERLNQLTQIVLATTPVREATDEQLVRLPTGDGMALVFRHSAEEPARCALEIAEALQKHPELPVRMGIHSGPVSEVTDVSGRTNIAGAGINMAQRVMDCGDAGHILLSQHVADDLVQYRQWAPRLRDLGECEVKHGVRLRLVNLYAEPLGNPEVPEKLLRPNEERSATALAKRRPLGLIAICLLVAAALLAAGLLFLRHRTAPNESKLVGSQKSIAVLPLLNESGDPKDEYFSDGLSEELIAALGHIGELKVIGRSSSFRFKERKDDSKTIGEKLGVATLLEGTVRKQGNRVRIVAELINAADGTAVWTQTFDRELKDIFAVQEEIATKVASSLKATLLGPEQRAAANPAPNNAEAHNAFLLGHYYFHRRNVADYRKAIGHFDQAITLDPGYALAYAERSETLTLLGDLTGEGESTWPKAREDAEKSVALAPALAEAHAALGWFLFFVDWKFTEGLKELSRAKELSPANPTANDLLGRVMVYVGKKDEAEKQARQAVDFDPLSFAPHLNLARVLVYEGKLDEAEVEARKAAELQPSAASSRRFQVIVAVERGDGAAALREAQLEPDEGYRRFTIALAQFVRGDRPAADAALADLIANGRGLAYQIAEVYAVRGEKDKAFEWLQTALEARDTGMLGLLVDPLIRDLRSDPRYQALVARMNFPTAP